MAVKARVSISRLQLAPSDTDMPFVLSWCQFPLRLAYSMTINKVQGQTFSKVGIYMQRPCFSYGQLYVTMSKARRFTDVKVEIINNARQSNHRGGMYTPNVVHRQILC